jgi:hypothetical protein
LLWKVQRTAHHGFGSEPPNTPNTVDGDENRSPVYGRLGLRKRPPDDTAVWALATTDRRTDGRTDGRTDRASVSRSAVASGEDEGSRAVLLAQLLRTLH